MTPDRRATRLARPFLFAAIASLVACGDRAPSPTLDATACAALGDASTTAEWLAQGAASALGRPLPAHCRVRGTLEPRTGARGVAYGTRFELRLPVPWNGRFLFQGGSGSDGVVSSAFGVTGGRSTLGDGFAVVTTDSGPRAVRRSLVSIRRHASTTAIARWTSSRGTRSR
jgi:hypothetical protein